MTLDEYTYTHTYTNKSTGNCKCMGKYKIISLLFNSLKNNWLKGKITCKSKMHGKNSTQEGQMEIYFL